MSPNIFSKIVLFHMLISSIPFFYKKLNEKSTIVNFAKFSARFRENFNWELTWYCWVAAPASDSEFLASPSSSYPRLFSAWFSSSLNVHIFFRRKQFAELRLPEIHYANIVQGIFTTSKCICKWLQYCKKNRHCQIQYIVYMNECFLAWVKRSSEAEFMNVQFRWGFWA